MSSECTDLLVCGSHASGELRLALFCSKDCHLFRSPAKTFFLFIIKETSDAQKPRNDANYVSWMFNSCLCSSQACTIQRSVSQDGINANVLSEKTKGSHLGDEQGCQHQYCKIGQHVSVPMTLCNHSLHWMWYITSSGVQHAFHTIGPSSTIARTESSVTFMIVCEQYMRPKTWYSYSNTLPSLYKLLTAIAKMTLDTHRQSTSSEVLLS